MSSTEDCLRTILLEELFIGQEGAKILPTDSLRQLGVDSLGFVELRNQIELKLNVVIPDTDFTPENFSTISSLAKMVDRSLMANRMTQS